MIPSPRAIYIAFEAFPRPKGASSHIAAMVEALAHSLPPVWLLCCGTRDLPALQLEDDVVIHRMISDESNVLKRTLAFDEFVARKLEEAGTRTECCVFRDPWGGAPVLSQPRSYRTVFEVNALPSWELGYRYPAFRNHFALRHKIRDLERFCLQNADRIIVVSSLTREALARRGVPETKMSLHPNSAADHFFKAHTQPNELSALEEGRWFGYVGSLHPWQGVPTAVKAFSMIAENHPDTRMLAITGARKPLRKQLYKCARKLGMAERLLVHKPLTPRQLAPVLARLEFTVAPLVETARNTVQGCCPIKIVESMASGTPVVASNIKVCRDLISPGVDGVLAEPESPRQWALAMHGLLSEPSHLKQLAQAASQTARQRFHRRRAREQLGALFLNTE